MDVVDKTGKDPIIDSGTPEEITKDDRQLAIMCHILGLMTGIITPLVYCLSKKGDSEFLLHHETEALNFQITVIILLIIAIGSYIVFNSYFLIPIAILIDITSSISAVMKAKEGVYYKYPISIPLVRTRIS